MEEDSSPDLEAVEGCRSRLTTAKPAEEPPASTVDVTNSKDVLHPNANSTPGQPIKQPIKWTDEKHSLYLGFLEASFISQFHGSSTGLLGWHSQENALDPNSIKKLPSKTCNSREQFTILHSGCWKKKKFERSEPPLNPAADSHVILENHWICHFRSAGKRCIVTSCNVQERSNPSSDGSHCENRNSSLGLEMCPEQVSACHLCHQDSVGSITEVSDQNFEDEDQGNKPSGSSVAKRFKVDEADASSNDQVVPSGKCSTTEVININNHHGLSANPESFVRPKSDVHNVSRGS